MNHNEFHLIERIIALSVADNWDQAKLEWILDHIVQLDGEGGDTPETCLCTHFPIMECCYLANTKNGNEALVGNVCVTKFMGIPSQLIFDCLKRLCKDIDKSQNTETIEFGKQKGWYTDWEYQFLVSTIRRRKLWWKQIEIRRELNDRILEKTKFQHPDLTKRREQIADKNNAAIVSDTTVPMCKHAADLLHKLGHLSPREHAFMRDMEAIKRPSPKQQVWRQAIIARIVAVANA